MTRKKLTAEESAIQQQKALDRRREASRLWRTKQLEARQAKQVQEASQSTAVAILKIERPRRNEPFETDDEDSQASTSCVQPVSGDGSILNQTATGRDHNLRTRKSPTPLPCGSIRSGTGPDLAPTAASQNSGHPDVSCYDGPLRDAREPSAARDASNAFKGKTIAGETLGLEALALSDHGEKEPTPQQDVSEPAKQAVHTADAPVLEQHAPSEDNFTTWEEEGLLVSDLDAANDGSSPCSAKLKVKREESAEFFEQPWPPGFPTDTAQATDDAALEAEELFYDTESADELTPDSSEEDEVPRRSARLERRGHYRNETSLEPPGPLESTDFLERQADVYRNIMQEMFAYTCHCHDSRVAGSDGQQVPPPLSMREMSSWIKSEIGDVASVLTPPQSVSQIEERPYEPQKWRRTLTACPAPLSLERTEDEVPRERITIERYYDVDSIMLGMHTLHAIPESNDSFRLTFVPSYMKSISGNQILQPHGVEIGRTRHICLGSFSIGNIALDIYMFFPNTNDGKPYRSKQQSNQTRTDVRYTLSYDRQKELVDGAILPALRATVPGIYRQEMPASFDIAQAMSTYHRERSGAHSSASGATLRSVHIRYTVPGRYVGPFSDALVERCNDLRIPSSRSEGGSFAYFQNAKFMCQVHDAKNMFASVSLDTLMDAFDHRILQGLCMEHVDTKSSTIDIGFRDMPEPYRDDDSGEEKQVTLLWKRPCLDHFHKQMVAQSPDMQLQKELFPGFNIRDAPTYDAKPKGIRGRAPKRSDPGNPDCTKLGVFHAKAYNCDKERFSVLSGERQMFDEPNFAAQALKDSMMHDIFVASHDPSNAVTGAPVRAKLEAAWEASKHRLRAVAQQTVPCHGYAARKETTFRLDVILWMRRQGYFTVSGHGESESLSAVGGAVRIQLGANNNAGQHYPYWVLDTASVNEFVCTSSLRFIQPLEHIFRLGRQEEASSSSKICARSIARFYTARMLLRLLMSSLSSERRWPSDRWIWEREWSVKARKEDGQRGRVVRRGLGLQASVEAYGLVWLGDADFNWLHSHIALERLLCVHMTRHPQHPSWAAESNVKGFAHGNVSTLYMVEDLLLKAKAMRQAAGDANVRAACANEKAAADIAAQEIAREYNKHFLCKLQSIWSKTNENNVAIRQAHPKGPPTLLLALQDVCAPTSRMVTAETMLTIYNEAWRIYAEMGDDGNLPPDLPVGVPNWMAKRSPKEQIWTLVVYETLFHASGTASWGRNAFITLYGRLKELYDRARHAECDDFDQTFRWRAGRYITVMFSPDKTKEVNVSPGSKSGLQGLPTFFRVQLWAPLINPHRCDLETGKIIKPQFPLGGQGVYYHQELQRRNMGLKQTYLAYKKVTVTTAWAYRQTIDTIQQVALDLCNYAESVLQTTGVAELDGSGSLVMRTCWDFANAGASSAALWEVAIEIPSLYAGAMPTVVMPTEENLRLIAKSGRALVARLGLMEDSAYKEVRKVIKMLRECVRVVEGLLSDDENRQKLLQTTFGKLEEVREAHEEEGDEGRLVELLGQTAPRQEWMV